MKISKWNLKSFVRMNLKMKLLLAFAVVILVLVAVGGGGVFFVEGIRGNVDNLTSSAIPLTRSSIEVVDGLHKYHIAALTLLAQNDHEEVQTQMENIKKTEISGR